MEKSEEKLKIAYLVLCHTDPNHIRRLSRRLSNHADVFVHVDRKENIENYKQGINLDNVYFIDDRLHAYWGGWNAVEALLRLMSYASKNGDYDRYIVMQGLDYPIKSDRFILEFFEKNKNIEFIRGCNTSIAKEDYFRDKSKGYYFYNTDCPARKVWNSFIRFLVKRCHIDIRKGYVIDGERYDVFWGAAQFAITGACVRYILEFSKEHKKFNQYFKHVFPVDETYFQSIVMNSPFVLKTIMGKADPPIKYLVNHRNLHYFTYDEGGVGVFTVEDYYKLKDRPELYCRKVGSEKSTELLDKLDEMEVCK